MEELERLIKEGLANKKSIAKIAYEVGLSSGYLYSWIRARPELNITLPGRNPNRKNLEIIIKGLEDGELQTSISDKLNINPSTLSALMKYHDISKNYDKSFSLKNLKFIIGCLEVGTDWDKISKDLFVKKGELLRFLKRNDIYEISKLKEFIKYLQELQDELDKGDVIEVIAERHNMQRYQLHTLIKRYSLEHNDRYIRATADNLTKVQELLDDGCTYVEIGERIGVSARTITLWVDKYKLNSTRKRYGRQGKPIKCSDKVLSKVQEYIKLGYSNKKISSLLNVSDQSIGVWIKRYNLTDTRYSDSVHSEDFINQFKEMYYIGMKKVDIAKALNISRHQVYTCIDKYCK